MPSRPGRRVTIMIGAAMLQLVEQCGEGVLVLCDGLEEREFLRSRVTRHEVRRRLNDIAAALDAVPAATRAAMPELAWDGWQLLHQRLRPADTAADAAAWFAATSLVPATLSWLRFYRRNEPSLFDFRLAPLPSP